jgi:hypothetical protein
MEETGRAEQSTTDSDSDPADAGRAVRLVWRQNLEYIEIGGDEAFIRKRRICIYICQYSRIVYFVHFSFTFLSLLAGLAFSFMGWGTLISGTFREQWIEIHKRGGEEEKKSGSQALNPALEWRVVKVEMGYGPRVPSNGGEKRGGMARRVCTVE